MRRSGGADNPLLRANVAPMNEARDAPFIVPESIRDQEVWHCFCYDGDDKIPAAPTAEIEYVDGYDPDPEYLVDFETAFEVVDKARRGLSGGVDGVMLNLGACDVVVIDLDDVVDDDGTLSDLAHNLTEDLTDTFWEISPSGNGLHGYLCDDVELDESYVQKDEGGLECYTSRAVTFTGRHVEGTSESILELDGALRAYQRQYNAKRDSEPTGDTSEPTHSVGSSPSIDRARDGGLGTDEFEGLVGADKEALSDQQRKVVEAMCEYDDGARALYEDGHEASCAVDDKSRNDMSLMGRIAWWGQTADMFDFSLSQSQIEEIFVISALGNRSKIRQRPDVVSLTAYNAINS